MRIIFVRHGEPDYALDCQTDRGKVQAAAAAERLAEESISEIYASPCGRASIILSLPVADGAYVFPRVELFNNCAHFKRNADKPVLQLESE